MFPQCLAFLKNLSVLLICSPCPHSANSNVCLFLCSWTGFNQVKSHLSPSAWCLFAHREPKAEPSKGPEEKFSPAESRLPPSIPGLSPPARRTTSHRVCAATQHDAHTAPERWLGERVMDLSAPQPQQTAACRRSLVPPPLASFRTVKV